MLLSASSFLTVLIGLLLVLLCVALTFHKNGFAYWKKRGVNYLEPTIPFGNAANFFLGRRGFGELFHDWYLEMKAKGWTMGGAYFCNKPVFIPIDNQLIKKILVSDFLHFQNHGLYINEEVDPLSGHMFNMENYKWKNLRSKIAAAFTAAKMRRNVVIMENISKVLLSRLNDMSLTKLPIEIKDVLSRFTIDVISACTLGIETKSLENQNLELTKKARPFFDNQFSRTSNTMVVLIPRSVLSFFKFKLFPTHVTKYFMNLFAEIKENRENEAIKRNDLADLLIDLCDKTKAHPDFSGNGTMEPLTFNEIAAQMCLFFEAGFETSSSTQTFALYELAANTDIQNRLRNEINSVLSRFSGDIGYDAINEMEYLDLVINETLRKYPIFPILPRACEKDYPIPDTDITIKKGTFVMVTNLGIHYDPEYYPDPMRFDPERFTAANIAKRPFCSYLPFGEGPRICIGKRFGIWQSKIGLVSIVRNFKITLSNKMKVPLSFQKSGLILTAQGNVWIDLERIK